MIKCNMSGRQISGRQLWRKSRAEAAKAARAYAKSRPGVDPLRVATDAAEAFPEHSRAAYMAALKVAQALAGGEKPKKR